MLDAILFKQPQHAITIGGGLDINGLLRQFIDGGEIACEPVPVGQIETIALCLEKGLTRFSTKAEGNIIALGITTASWNRHEHEQK